MEAPLLPDNLDDAVAAIDAALLDTLLVQAPVGFAFFDSELRYQRINDTLAEINGIPAAAHFGRTPWEVLPDLSPTATENLLRVLETGEPLMNVEVMGETPAAPNVKRYWLASYYPVRGAGGQTLGVGAIVSEITERKQAETALRESEAIKGAILETALDCIIAIDCQGRIIEFNPAAEQTFGYRRDEVLGREMAQLIIPPAYRDRHRAGLAHYLATGDGPLLGKRIEITALRKEGAEFPVELAITPIGAAGGPRFTAYLRDITERKRAEVRNKELLAVVQARARQESLLNRIGQALRDSTNPQVIQGAAMRVLGEALGADRCFFALYGAVTGLVSIGQDWHRPDLPSLADGYRLSDLDLDPDDLYPGQEPLVLPDVRTAALSSQSVAALEGLGLRSAISAGLFEEGRLAASLSVAMADAPREWTREEVALVEAVAAQTRSAVEAARERERERNIAERLQEALRPTLPGKAAGLEIKDYYQAALEESSLGGDFFDVFTLEKGVLALVVGDLSGKGLAAAAQVATVRHMLRSMLYLHGTVAEAVTRLNNLLAEHSLLPGFATLFVGVYNTGDHTLTYVSCGQEPGLLYRAVAGQVDELPPTGPVLGAFAGVDFDEAVVGLSPGDALALFTDGLTEAGPSRHDLLGLGGVAALLKEQAALQGTIEQLLAGLIAGVETFARGGIRDDVCLLLARCE